MPNWVVGMVCNTLCAPLLLSMRPAAKLIQFIFVRLC